VDASMNIGVISLIIADQCIDDLPWFLTGSGIIKIDEGMPIDLLRKDREILSQLKPVWGGRGHGLLD
jgi:hypothetical protein